jgi:hypothetical protein
MEHKIILCERYDIEGIWRINDAITSSNPSYFLQFLESKDAPGFYIIFSGNLYDVEGYYHHLNNTGECDFGDGCGRANVNEPISIGRFSPNFAWRFRDFIMDNYSLKQKPITFAFNVANGVWHHFIEFDPDYWLRQFIEHEINRSYFLNKKNKSAIDHQLELFD